MVVVGFPQKSSFGVLTATEVRTPTVNNPAGTLLLQAANVNALELTGAYLNCYDHVRLITAKNIVDNALNTLIDPDDAGAIAGLARLDGALTFPDYGLKREIPVWQNRISGGAVRDTVKLRSNVSETLVILVQHSNPSVNYNFDMTCIGIRFYVGTTSVNDKVDEVRFGGWDSGIDGFNVAQTDPTDRADGAIPAQWDWIFASPQSIHDGVFAIEIDTVIATANIDINGIVLWMGEA